MIAAASLENRNASFENFEVIRNSNVLPEGIDLNNDGNSVLLQNYIIQPLEDGNYQLVLCESQVNGGGVSVTNRFNLSILEWTRF